MRLIFSTVLLVLSFLAYSQSTTNNFELHAYVSKIDTDSLTLSEFLKQKELRLNSSILKVKSYVAYIFPCPGCLVNDATIITVQGSSLKGKGLSERINNIKAPFYICFNNIEFYNTRKELKSLPKEYCIKVY